MVEMKLRKGGADPWSGNSFRENREAKKKGNENHETLGIPARQGGVGGGGKFFQGNVLSGRGKKAAKTESRKPPGPTDSEKPRRGGNSQLGGGSLLKTRAAFGGRGTGGNQEKKTG